MANAKRTQAPTAAEVVTVQTGNLTWDIPRETLQGLTPIAALDQGGAISSGIVLASARQKVTILHNEDQGPTHVLPVEYTISLQITRAPIGNVEAAAVTDAKDTSKAKKDQKAKEAAEQHARDIQAAEQKTREMLRDALQMGRADMVESISNMAKLTPALKAIKTLAADL